MSFYRNSMHAAPFVFFILAGVSFVMTLVSGTDLITRNGSPGLGEIFVTLLDAIFSGAIHLFAAAILWRFDKWLEAAE